MYFKRNIFFHFVSLSESLFSSSLLLLHPSRDFLTVFSQLSFDLIQY